MAAARTPAHRPQGLGDTIASRTFAHGRGASALQRGVVTVVLAALVLSACGPTRYLDRPEPYPRPPAPTPVDTDAPERRKDVVIYAGAEAGQVITVATPDDRPAVCDDEYGPGFPSDSRPAPRVCRADFVVVHDGRIEHLGEYRDAPPGEDDPAVDAALEPLREAGVVETGIGDPNVAFVELAPGELLMPGLVDAHTHIFNRPEAILDQQGVAIGDRVPDGPDARQQALSLAQDVALRAGITSVGNLFANPNDLNELTHFNEKGELRIRVSLYLAHNNPGGVVLEPEGWYEGEFPASGRPRRLGDRLRIEGIKVFVDGGAIGRRAVSYESHVPYGDLWFEGGAGQLALNEVVREAQCNGLQVALHAAGDLAIPVAIKSIDAALDDSACGSGDGNPLRHRLEHFRIVTPDLVRAALDNDVGIAIPFWNWTCDPHIPPEAFWDKYHNYSALVDAGVVNGLHVAWHGDAPSFSFWRGAVYPFIELHNAVTRVAIPRTLWHGLDSGACFAPRVFRANRLTVAEALPMMTMEGAYLIHREDQVGSLSPGKKADLIVVSDDPLALEAATDPDTIHRLSVPEFRSGAIRMVDNPIHDIRNVRVWMTMIDGRVEFCGEGHEPLCWSAS